MTEVYMEITGAVATARKVGPLTAGMVGVPVVFSFSPEWQELNLLAVFRAGEEKKDNEIKEGRSVIPAQVLTQPGQMLCIGVEGRSKDGALVIPTVWAEVGRILDGAQAANDPALAPTPTQFERFMAGLEQVDEKLEDALKQARDTGEFDGPAGPQGEKGDRGDPGLDGSSIVSISSVKPSTNLETGRYGASVTVKTARPDGSDPRRFSFWVDHGYTPVKGVDYFTQKEKQELTEGFIRSVNGASPDANGNVQIETGGVSSWDDMPAPMPGKILPEGVPYVERGEVVEVLPECQPEYDEGENMFIVAEGVTVMTAGESYTVNWNGTEYECVAQDMSAMMPGAILLGEGSNFGLPSTGEPFMMAATEEDGIYFLAIVPLDGTTELTLSIKNGSVTIRKIDPRCLPKPEDYYFVSDLSDTGNFNEDVSNADKAIKSGAKAYAKYNNRLYEVVQVVFEPIDLMHSIVLQNTGVTLYGYKTASNMPFKFRESICTDMNTGKLPTGLMPEVRSVVLLSSTNGSSKKFKLTVDDSGTITATEVT